MTDIRELALQVATETLELEDSFESGSKYAVGDDELTYFAQRFLAAYLAEQEPVAYVAYEVGRAPHFVPVINGRVSFKIDGYAKLFTAPPEPAPQEAQIDASHSPTDMGVNPVGAAPSSEEVREMVDQLGWYADKIHAYRDYAKSAAAKMLKSADMLERLAFGEKNEVE